MRLAAKVALVTGGATGMGRAIVEAFAAEGAKVVINFRSSRAEADDLAARITAAGGDALAHQADVTQDSEVRAMVAAVESRWGRLDILVNNAGWTRIVPHAQLDDLTDEIWDQALDVNLRGAFYCARAAAPLLRRSPDGGAIINNASAAAVDARGSSIAYSAAKAGLVNMTKSLARALAPSIRVNAIMPGFVRTQFADFPEALYAKVAAESPLGRLPTTREVASAVLFLAADATATTGQAILIDGGRL